MASEEKHYSAEFKTRIAKQAEGQSHEELEALAENNEIPVSAILTWRAQYQKEGEKAFRTENVAVSDRSGDSDTVEVEVNNENVDSGFKYGVMLDDLNIKRLTFWSVVGIILVVIFVKALVEMYQYNTQVTREKIAAESVYYDLNQLREQANQRLSSFGVVDAEEGIYHIPIDSAMNEIANEGN